MQENSSLCKAAASGCLFSLTLYSINIALRYETTDDGKLKQKNVKEKLTAHLRLPLRAWALFLSSSAQLPPCVQIYSNRPMSCVRTGGYSRRRFDRAWTDRAVTAIAKMFGRLLQLPGQKACTFLSLFFLFLRPRSWAAREWPPFDSGSAGRCASHLERERERKRHDGLGLSFGSVNQPSPFFYFVCRLLSLN